MKHFPTLHASVLALGLATLAAPAIAEGISVTVNNQGSLPITLIYMNPNEITEWGPDRLNGRTIDPGTRREINVPNTSASCTYDVMIQTTDGSGATADQVLRYSECGSGDLYVQ
jgi:hypothetical protein